MSKIRQKLLYCDKIATMCCINTTPLNVSREMLQENIKRGVNWLDSQRPLLQEYNDVDRHTMPITGDLVV